MKICQVVPHYLPAHHFGGVQHVAHALSRALLAQGHQVRVCTTNLKNPREVLDVPVSVPVQVDGVEIYYEPVNWLRYWGFSPALARRVRAESAWADVTLIHFHYQFASLAAGLACRMQGKPYLVFTHGSLNQYGITAKGRLRKRLYIALVEGGNFRRAQYVAYHSPEERENSIQIGRGVVVPNGIEPQNFKDLPAPGAFRERYPELKGKLVYLFLGRLDQGKGLEILLPAFRELMDSSPQVRLVLAGADERGYGAQVDQQIRDLEIGQAVIKTGLISGQEKLAALQDADVFVLPSRSEGLSMAMLEAMYMGLPVVVTDRVGLWREIQREDCGLVVPYAAAPLAEAMKDISLDPQRRQMGDRGHALVSTCYTWEAITHELVQILQPFSHSH